MRRATRRAAGARYQATRPGRRRHAARQQHDRVRRAAAQKVTHHAPRRTANAGTTALARGRIDSRAEEVPDAPPGGSRPLPFPVRCARCGHASRFVRHDTLARVRPAPGPARRPPP